MADRGGSQCGYCTPGFICSMAAEYYRADRTPTGRRRGRPGNRQRRPGGGRPGRARSGRRPRARPERLRPARAVREPVPLHRVPADPGRRLRARRPAGVRRAGATPVPAGPGPGPDRDHRRRDRVPAADRPGPGADPAGRTPGRPAARRVHRLGRGAEHPARPRRPDHRRGPHPRARHPGDRRRPHRHRRRADPVRDRTRPGRAGAAAGRDVPAVRLPADPQRRHPRREPGHRLADRRQPARAAGTGRLAGAGVDRR